MSIGQKAQVGRPNPWQSGRLNGRLRGRFEARRRVQLQLHYPKVLVFKMNYSDGAIDTPKHNELLIETILSDLTLGRVNLRQDEVC